MLVRADPRRLKQVLANLLSNAVKYNRPGGQVLVDLQRDGGQVVCSVRDTAPGLSPAHMARLFTPFDRLGLEHSAIKGRGLGLALSRQLATDLGGGLSVHSSPGPGRLLQPAPAGRRTVGLSAVLVHGGVQPNRMVVRRRRQVS